MAILFDLSGSMKEKDGGTESRLLRAAKGLETMLARLPEGTMVSLSFFSGSAANIVTLPPTKWDQPKQRAKDVFDDLMNRERNLGGATDLANSILRVLDGDGFFPAKDFAGFRSVIVITDGSDTVTDNVDNPATSRPGQKIINRFNDAARRGGGANGDVALHLVLFGADDFDTPRAYTQFGAIADPASYTDRNRTIPQIWPSKAEYDRKIKLVRSDELAEKLKEAMLPTTTVLSYDKTLERRLPTSIGTDQTIRWLDPTVPDGIYNLIALGGTQKVQFRPGERFLLDLEIDRKGPKFILPPFASAYGLTGAPRGQRRSNGAPDGPSEFPHATFE